MSDEQAQLTRIAELQEQQDVHALAELGEHESKKVRKAARRALHILKTKGIQGPEESRVFKLESGTSDESAEPRRRAAAFFKNCGQLSEDEYDDCVGRERRETQPYNWKFEKEDFVADELKIGTGFWPAYWELFGTRGGKPVKMILGTPVGLGDRHYRFVDPDFDVSPYIVRG